MMAALIASLDDHTTDQRGDIGSLVRLEAVSTIQVALDCGTLGRLNVIESLTAAVCPLALEKLDKVRLRASHCFERLFNCVSHTITIQGNGQMENHSECLALSRAQDFRGQMSSYNDPTELSAVSTLEYFHHILSRRHAFDCLQQPLLKGYVSSAGAGSESVLIASRTALAWYLEINNDKRSESFFRDLERLLRNEQGNERLVLPILETLAYSLDLVDPDAVGDDQVA